MLKNPKLREEFFKAIEEDASVIESQLRINMYDYDMLVAGLNSKKNSDIVLRYVKENIDDLEEFLKPEQFTAITKKVSELENKKELLTSINEDAAIIDSQLKIDMYDYDMLIAGLCSKANSESVMVWVAEKIDDLEEFLKPEQFKTLIETVARLYNGINAGLKNHPGIIKVAIRGYESIIERIGPSNVRENCILFVDYLNNKLKTIPGYDGNGMQM